MTGRPGSERRSGREVKTLTQQDFQNMKTGEVVEMARKAGIQDVEKKNKQQLIEELERQQSSQPRRGDG